MDDSYMSDSMLIELTVMCVYLYLYIFLEGDGMTYFCQIISVIYNLCMVMRRNN